MNRIEEAIIFATKAHEGQKRKMSNIPYILHPLEVASIISSITKDEDVIIAGILHDTIEDANISYDEILDKFGRRVASLVQSETEDKYLNIDKEKTWKTRKEDSLLMLEHTKDINVKILWLSDKLSNIRSFYKEFLESKYDLFNNLNQKDPLMHKWYYETILSYLTELSNTTAYMELKDLTNRIFGGLK